MADIDQILAGGAGSSSRADFSGIADIPKAYWEGKDQRAKNDLRDAFKGGVPLDASGQPDFGAMAKALFQKGGLEQGVAASNLGIARDQLRLGQETSANMGRLEGGQQQPIVGPSVNRNSVSPDPGQRADASTSAPQQPQGGATLMQVLSSQGIPNDQLGAASASVARQLGLQDPNAPINLQDPQVRNVLVPAVQQLKRMGIGQVVPEGQPSPPPLAVPPQVAQAPNPQQNQGTFGAPPATPTRGAVPTGMDPEIQKQIATYTAIASNPAYPKPVQEAALTRLKALQEQGQPTGPIKEYDLYRRQGGNMPFKDFLADLESGKAGATERAKADVKEQQEYIDAGKSSSQRLTTLNAISNVVNGDKAPGMGYAGDTELKVKMALQRLGFDFGDLSGAQLMQKMNASLAAEMAKSLTARSTQFEFKTFLSNNPGLLLDKTGNQRLIGIFSQLAKREVDLGKLARQNQDNWQNWDKVVEKYDAQKEHQVIDPISKQPISTNSIVAPAPATKAAAPALEPGKTMVNGHVYKGGPPNQKSSWELRS